MTGLIPTVEPHQPAPVQARHATPRPGRGDHQAFREAFMQAKERQSSTIAQPAPASDAPSAARDFDEGDDAEVKDTPREGESVPGIESSILDPSGVLASALGADALHHDLPSEQAAPPQTEHQGGAFRLEMAVNQPAQHPGGDSTSLVPATDQDMKVSFDTLDYPTANQALDGNVVSTQGESGSQTAHPGSVAVGEADTPHSHPSGPPLSSMSGIAEGHEHSGSPNAQTLGGESASGRRGARLRADVPERSGGAAIGDDGRRTVTRAMRYHWSHALSVEGDDGSGVLLDDMVESGMAMDRWAGGTPSGQNASGEGELLFLNSQTAASAEASSASDDLSRESLAGNGASATTNSEEPESRLSAERAHLQGSEAQDQTAGRATLHPATGTDSSAAGAHLEQAPAEPASEPDTIGRQQQAFSLEARRFENVARGPLEHMVRHVEGEVQGENASLKMQLNPGRLGDLELKLEMERGVLTARFLAASEEVKAMIESALPDLKRQLADQGVSVNELSVFVGQSKEERESGERDGWGRRQVGLSRPVDRGGSAAYESASSDRPLGVASATGVDVVV